MLPQSSVHTCNRRTYLEAFYSRVLEIARNSEKFGNSRLLMFNTVWAESYGVAQACAHAH